MKNNNKKISSKSKWLKIITASLTLQVNVIQAETNYIQEYAIVPLAPADHWVSRLELRYNEYDQFFNDNGDKKDFLSEYDGINFDSGVFPALALFGSGASLGQLSLSGKTKVKRMEFTLGYGLTEDLTIGAIVPYGEVCSQINIGFKGGNIGANPLFNPNLPVGVTNSPYAPVALGAIPLNTASLNQIITSPQYGYKTIKSRCHESFGDPVVGILWRVFNTDYNALVAGVGGRIGVVEQDDPDDLFDIPLDNGNNDFLAQLEYFHVLPYDFDLRLMVKYTLQTEDEIKARVGSSSNSILIPVSQKRTVKRDLGDFFEYDIELGKRIGDWRLSGTLHLWRKEKDSFRYAGSGIKALEKNTEIEADQWRVKLAWSGVNAWRQGYLPMPLVVQLEYQNTFSGKNMPSVEDLYLTLQTAF